MREKGPIEPTAPERWPRRSPPRGQFFFYHDASGWHDVSAHGLRQRLGRPIAAPPCFGPKRPAALPTGAVMTPRHAAITPGIQTRRAPRSAVGSHTGSCGP